VIASGGVGTLNHLVEGIRDGHASAVLAASIFHFGTFSIGEAKAHMARAGLPMRIGRPEQGRTGGMTFSLADLEARVAERAAAPPDHPGRPSSGPGDRRAPPKSSARKRSNSSLPSPRAAGSRSSRRRPTCSIICS